MYMSDEQRRDAQNGTRPEGLRPKFRHASLLSPYLGSPNFVAFALPAKIWGGNACA
jgi:hypothetical protein